MLMTNMEKNSLTPFIADIRKQSIQRMRGMLFNFKREFNLTDTELANVLGEDEDFLYDFMREKYDGVIPSDLLVKLLALKRPKDEDIVDPMGASFTFSLMSGAKNNETTEKKVEKFLKAVGIETESDIDRFLEVWNNFGVDKNSLLGKTTNCEKDKASSPEYVCHADNADSEKSDHTSIQVFDLSNKDDLAAVLTIIDKIFNNSIATKSK